MEDLSSFQAALTKAWQERGFSKNTYCLRLFPNHSALEILDPDTA